MTITRQQAGELRNSESISGIGKGVLSNPGGPDGLYSPLSRLSGVQEDHSVAVKQPGREAVVYCPV